MKIKEMVQAVDEKCIDWQLTAEQKLHSFLSDERGDTNFISIIVILAIALVVAGLFIGFKDQIITRAEQMINDFLSIF